MNLSRLFIQRPVATSLLMVALLLVGILAYRLLPVSSLPEADYSTIQVTTFYPGASPNVMATSVTAPLERQFGQMPGLTQMTSSSASTASVIVLQFSLSMSLDVAEQEVQAAINAASSFLPPDLPYPPIYNKVNPADTPIITVGLTSKTLPLTQVEDLADTRLTQKISQLSGVGLVSLSGGQRPAVRVQANTDALASYSLTLEGIRSSIAAASVNAAKGNFDGPRLAYTIQANDQLLSSADYRPLIIAYRNNAPVRLQDVAQVIDDAENVKQAAWMNTTPAVIMNVQRQPGANVIAVADRVKVLLQQLKTILPPAVDVKLLTDRTVTIRASVKEVQWDLILAVMLVVSVIFIFLKNFTATLITSVAVPLSLIGTFSVMYLCGFSLNNLTLMALTISTGFVADDAIVMIENITRYLEQGETPLAAALKGSAQIGFTILSLTISLIAVLIPLLFMGDIVGRLFREFAVTLSVTILISAFISLTLTPMLCGRFLHSRAAKTSHPFLERINALQKSFFERYHASLRWVLDHQPQVLAAAIMTLILTGILFYTVPKGFFPVEDTGVIQGFSEASQSISFAAMAERQQALAKVVLSDPAVDNISSFIGIDGTNMTLNSGRILVTLKPLDQRDTRASEILRRLQLRLAAVPGATLYLQPVQDLTVDTRVSRTQYQYSISSPAAAEVILWSTRLSEKLQASPVLRDVANDQQNLGLQTWITIDRDTASRLGISAQSIDDSLYDAFGQRQISTVFTQRNQYHVVLETLPKWQDAQSSLNHIYLNSASNGAVPLSVFTEVSQKTGPLVIHRQNQFPVAILSFNLAPGAALGDAVHAIEKAKQELAVPDSVQTEFEGTAATFQRSLANEGWLVLAAVITVYIVLGVLYESFIHPLTILSTLPSAGMGALLALYLAGDELSVIALIGIILLIGIVMKNAIMMIDFALEKERTEGKSPREAIYEAALLRFRPILMTTLASLLGAVPLAFGTGMGAELRHPLGLVIIGGLAISQLLTLYTTPVVYLTFDRLLKNLY